MHSVSIDYVHLFKQVISEARKVWDRMKNKDDRKVRMTHDGEVMKRVV